MTAQHILLAQILQDNTIYYNCDLTADDFLNHLDRRTFVAIGEILDTGSKPDIVSIYNHDNTIKPSYLAKLEYHTTLSWKLHAKTIKKESDLYRMQMIQLTISDMLKSDADPKEISAEVERLLMKGSKRSEVKTIKHHVRALVDDVEKAFKSHGALPGIDTGFQCLNKVLLGIQPLYYVIGARPAQGKTALGLQLAANLAREVPVGIISAEMEGKSLMRRLLSNGSGIPLKQLKTGLLKNMNEVTKGAGMLYDLDIYIDDTPNIKLQDLKASIRSMVRVHDIKAVVVDYIGLINNTSRLPRHEQIMQISQALKQLTRELKIAIIALSQVGRQADNKAPSLADLRESGSIEQDADCVIFIYHERKEEDKIEQSYFIVAKQRDGETGWFRVNFDGAHVKFTDSTY